MNAERIEAFTKRQKKRIEAIQKRRQKLHEKDMALLREFIAEVTRQPGSKGTVLVVQPIRLIAAHGIVFR